MGGPRAILNGPPQIPRFSLLAARPRRSSFDNDTFGLDVFPDVMDRVRLQTHLTSLILHADQTALNPGTGSSRVRAAPIRNVNNRPGRTPNPDLTLAILRYEVDPNGQRSWREDGSGRRLRVALVAFFLLGSCPALDITQRGFEAPRLCHLTNFTILLPPNSIIDISIPGTGAYPFYCTFIFLSKSPAPAVVE
ncbi:hypothetical protein B0H17DRAFT_1208458 [Mycena rosella]|uniref:Uncharacterized protein n=1 Tax=Mycena rosella TaxID=1033263 RepID=A0AAD7G6T4_MYCRO|nr:hypothetical protein B0H17DRAFT_1208458 [Mycena rosella]